MSRTAHRTSGINSEHFSIKDYSKYANYSKYKLNESELKALEKIERVINSKEQVNILEKYNTPKNLVSHFQVCYININELRLQIIERKSELSNFKCRCTLMGEELETKKKVMKENLKRSKEQLFELEDRFKVMASNYIFILDNAERLGYSKEQLNDCLSNNKGILEIKDKEVLKKYLKTIQFLSTTNYDLTKVTNLFSEVFENVTKEQQNKVINKLYENVKINTAIFSRYDEIFNIEETDLFRDYDETYARVRFLKTNDYDLNLYKYITSSVAKNQKLTETYPLTDSKKDILIALYDQEKTKNKNEGFPRVRKEIGG